MPIYEYACRSCGQHLEVAQSFMDDPLTTCAVCEGPLRKVYGSIGISFKGSGFYRTDSRGSSTNGAKRDAGEKVGADTADKGTKVDAGTKGEGSSPGGLDAGKDASGPQPSKAAEPKASKAKAASA